MKALTVAQQKQQNEYAAELADAKGVLLNAHAAYVKAVQTYNAHLAGVRDWTDEVAEEMADYYEGKSEAWQDSDAGCYFQDWQHKWERIDLDDVDLPDDLTLDHGDNLSDLNTAPFEG